MELISRSDSVQTTAGGESAVKAQRNRLKNGSNWTLIIFYRPGKLYQAGRGNIFELIFCGVFFAALYGSLDFGSFRINPHVTPGWEGLRTPLLPRFKINFSVSRSPPFPT